MILSLPTKHRSIRPTDHGKAMRWLNENLTFYKEVGIEIMDSGKFKVYGTEFNTLPEAHQAVDERYILYYSSINLNPNDVNRTHLLVYTRNGVRVGSRNLHIQGH